ncbi:MAG: hypothetical protein ATN32_06280 [Candidatus Epulonipiscium fishelsonii]|nr:MAG: hypothetical protein ATN32_06280 [Epulopiscium sp. AS2M-Bin002]
MELKSCRKCKALFQYSGGKILCITCRADEEDSFLIVKDFLRENPSASLEMVNSETSVPIKLIKEFIRDGRLEVSNRSPLAVDCERCGKKTTSGRICPACKNQIARELSSVGKISPAPNKAEEPEYKGMRSKR